MVLVSIVIDIERIGDYCKKSLTWLGEVYPQKLNIGAYNEVLSEIEREIKDCFQQAPRILRSTMRSRPGRLC